MTVTLPNLNEAIAGLDGRLLPFGWLRCCGGSRCGRCETGGCRLMGIAKRLQGTTKGRPGAGRDRADPAALPQHGYRHGELSWVLEDNRAVQAVIERDRRRCPTSATASTRRPSHDLRPTTSALVLAGSRSGRGGPGRPLPRRPHKCLATAGGVPMLARVVRALAASPRIGGHPGLAGRPGAARRLPELGACARSGRLRLRWRSATSLSASVADGLRACRAAACW